MPSPRTWTQPIIAAVITSFLGIAGCNRGEALPPGDVAATLIAPTLGETVFDPETLKGKPAVVMFVSPTCSHCLAEMPRVQKLASETGIGVVAVFVSGNADAAVAVVKRTGFTGVVLVDDGALRKKYDVRAVPYMLVLGPDGFARKAFRGEQAESTLRDAIASSDTRVD